MNKKNTSHKVKRFEFLNDQAAHNRAQIIANEYAGGNLGAWIRYAMLEAPRRYLKPHEIKRKFK